MIADGLTRARAALGDRLRRARTDLHFLGARDMDRPSLGVVVTLARRWKKEASP